MHHSLSLSFIWQGVAALYIQSGITSSQVSNFFYGGSQVGCECAAQCVNCSISLPASYQAVQIRQF